MPFLALCGTKELFYERAVQARRGLDDPVPGYADDPGIVMVVGPIDDAGGLTAPLHHGEIALGDDPPHVGPNRSLEYGRQALVGGLEELALAARFTREGFLPVTVQWTSSATWSEPCCESPRS